MKISVVPKVKAPIVIPKAKVSVVISKAKASIIIPEAKASTNDRKTKISLLMFLIFKFLFILSLLDLFLKKLRRY